jgi:hypothetical protein
MSQPVKLSDALVLDARLTGRTAERSIAGQIEFWAKLGRAVEPLIQGVQSMALSRAAEARPLSECIVAVGTARGEQQRAEYLGTLPYPHYEPAPSAPGLLIRIAEDGTRHTGRFVNRKFKVLKPRTRQR